MMRTLCQSSIQYHMICTLYFVFDFATSQLGSFGSRMLMRIQSVHYETCQAGTQCMKANPNLKNMFLDRIMCMKCHLPWNIALPGNLGKCLYQFVSDLQHKLHTLWHPRLKIDLQDTAHM